VLLHVRGTFDEAAGLAVVQILDDRLGDSAIAHVVIDLVGVTTLGSGGVTTLHLVHRACRTTGLHLVLVGTANPAVHRYLYLSGLLPLVDARPTVEAALRAGTSPSASPSGPRSERRGRPGWFWHAVARDRSRWPEARSSRSHDSCADDVM